MVREAHVTEQQIAATATDLLAAGLKPTSREIRARLGTGSMGTILRGLQKWKSDHTAAMQERGLPPALQQAIFDCLLQEQAWAKQSYEQRFADQQAELEVLLLENERQAAEIDSLNTLLESLKTMTTLKKRRNADLHNALDHAEATCERLRADAEAARTEVDKLRLKLEFESVLKTLLPMPGQIDGTGTE